MYLDNVWGVHISLGVRGVCEIVKYLMKNTPDAYIVSEYLVYINEEQLFDISVG